MSDESTVLDATGQPARRARETRCPRCGQGRDQRAAVGFGGGAHDVCLRCGHDFDELTVVETEARG